jgi:hypothetical protein
VRLPGLVYKDVRLCVGEAEHIDVPVVVGSAVHDSDHDSRVWNVSCR